MVLFRFFASRASEQTLPASSMLRRGTVHTEVYYSGITWLQVKDGIGLAKNEYYIIRFFTDNIRTAVIDQD